VIELPPGFKPTHETAGLPGFPAVDVFGQPREMVRVHFWGRVVRVSGHPPWEGGSPGGAYGRSLYIENKANGITRFLTHLDELAVAVGDNIRPGQVVATVCDSKVSGKPGTTHVHYARHQSPGVS